MSLKWYLAGFTQYTIFLWLFINKINIFNLKNKNCILVLQVGMLDNIENPHLVSPGDLGKSDHIVQFSAKPQENSLYSPKLPSSVKNKQANKTKPKSNKPDWNKARNIPGIWNKFTFMCISYVSTDADGRQASSGNNLC